MRLNQSLSEIQATNGGIMMREIDWDLFTGVGAGICAEEIGVGEG